MCEKTDVYVKEDYKEFKKDLVTIINKHSMESQSNTPDFILAEYLVNCLYAYNKAVSNKVHWNIEESNGC